MFLKGNSTSLGSNRSEMIMYIQLAGMVCMFVINYHYVIKEKWMNLKTVY